MEKDKMIEEMLRIMCIGYHDNCNECPMSGNCANELHAEKLYNAGYRKVPEGSVVLTAEERDEEMREYNRDRAENEERASKETVKKIIDFLNEQGNFGYDYPDEPHSPIVTFDPCIFEDIEREFGLEVE